MTISITALQHLTLPISPTAHQWQASKRLYDGGAETTFKLRPFCLSKFSVSSVPYVNTHLRACLQCGDPVLGELSIRGLWCVVRVIIALGHGLPVCGCLLIRCGCGVVSPCCVSSRWIICSCRCVASRCIIASWWDIIVPRCRAVVSRRVIVTRSFVRPRRWVGRRGIESRGCRVRPWGCGVSRGVLCLSGGGRWWRRGWRWIGVGILEVLVLLLVLLILLVLLHLLIVLWIRSAVKKKMTIKKRLPHMNQPSGLWCETPLYKPNQRRCRYANVSVYLATGSTPSGAFVVEADSSSPPLGVGSSARRLGLVWANEPGTGSGRRGARFPLMGLRSRSGSVVAVVVPVFFPACCSASIFNKNIWSCTLKHLDINAHLKTTFCPSWKNLALAASKSTVGSGPAGVSTSSTWAVLSWLVISW